MKDILKNPVYIGKISWNKRKTVKKYKDGKIIKSRPRNTDVILADGLHEPIIDNTTWKIVQEKLSKHKPPVQHNNIVYNPLAGIIYCSKCGRKMQRRPYRARGWDDTLICSNNDCDNVSSKLYIVEDKVIEALNEWLKDYRINCDEYVQEINNKKKKTLEDNVRGLNKELELQEKKLSNVYDFFEEGTYSKEMFADRCRTISTTISNIKRDIEEFEKLIDIEIKKENREKSDCF